jgi:hypothetical protein
MTRTALFKTFVVSAVLASGSSAANAIGFTYNKLTCTYSAARVGIGPVPIVTIRNIGTRIIPAKAHYTIVHANPAATIHLTLARVLGPKQQASAPIQQNLGSKPSTCTASVMWFIGGI